MLNSPSKVSSGLMCSKHRSNIVNLCHKGWNIFCSTKKSSPEVGCMLNIVLSLRRHLVHWGSLFQHIPNMDRNRRSLKPQQTQGLNRSWVGRHPKTTDTRNGQLEMPETSPKLRTGGCSRMPRDLQPWNHKEATFRIMRKQTTMPRWWFGIFVLICDLYQVPISSLAAWKEKTRYVWTTAILFVGWQFGHQIVFGIPPIVWMLAWYTSEIWSGLWFQNITNIILNW